MDACEVLFLSGLEVWVSVGVAGVAAMCGRVEEVMSEWLGLLGLLSVSWVL